MESDPLPEIDRVKLRARHGVRGHMQHGFRIPILQQQRHALFRVRIFAILNILPEGWPVTGGHEGGECGNLCEPLRQVQSVCHSFSRRPESLGLVAEMCTASVNPMTAERKQKK